MERVEAVLLGLLPTLKQHQIGSWNPAEVERLCAMLKEYNKQERDEMCGTSCSKGTANVAAASPSSGALPSSPRDDAEVASEEDTDEEAFINAVGEVDRCLGRVRNFLKRRMDYGSVVEPTAPAGAARPQSCVVSSASKKRPRSPSNEASPSTATPNALHDDTAAVSTPVYSVDAFLYSEDDIERLVEEKKVAREYCRRCGCTDLGLTEFITHSFSQDQLVYLSCFLLPHLLEEFAAPHQTPRRLSIADVGSRMGIVLWACASARQWGLLAPQRSVAAEADAGDALPNVQLVGIELDAHFVKVSKDVLHRFFAPRRRLAPKWSSDVHPAAAEGAATELVDVSSSIELLESDCFEGAAAAALSESTVVVMHNVFEYFCPTVVEHARCWLRLRRLVHRSGQLLVCSPPLEETMGAFTEEVWQQACELEKCGNAESTPAPPLDWLAAYVDPLNTSEIASDFLSLRTLSSEDAEDASTQDEHERNDPHHHHHHHHGNSCDNCPLHGNGEEHGNEEEVSEVMEQIQQIRVYRVK